jgi:hypothetical protein
VESLAETGISQCIGASPAMVEVIDNKESFKVCFGLLRRSNRC